MLCSGHGTDGFGIKTVRFFGGIRDDSNGIIHYRLTIFLIAGKELPPDENVVQIGVELPEMHNTSRELHNALVDVVKVRFVEIIWNID